MNIIMTAINNQKRILLMGTVRKTVCGKCNHERFYTIGVGQAFGNRLMRELKGDTSLQDMTLKKLMDNKLHTKMLSIIGSLPQRPHISDGNAILECKSCNISYPHYHVRFEYGEEQYFSSAPPCENCNGILTGSTKELSEYACISCGELSITDHLNMHWD